LVGINYWTSQLNQYIIPILTYFETLSRAKQKGASNMRIRINFTGELLFVALSLFFVMSASAIVNAEHTIISTEEMKKKFDSKSGDCVIIDA
jgi:hypothetical protein